MTREMDIGDYIAEANGDLRYVIIRADRAGVFAGFLEEIRDTPAGRIAIMRNTRRIWQWAGAASLSQLAIDGTSRPNDCKFPAPMSRIEVSQVIEVIDCTAAAQSSIQGVRVWRQ